jgi:hypothetical protein
LLLACWQFRACERSEAERGRCWLDVWMDVWMDGWMDCWMDVLSLSSSFSRVLRLILLLLPFLLLAWLLACWLLRACKRSEAERGRCWLDVCMDVWRDGWLDGLLWMFSWNDLKTLPLERLENVAPRTVRKRCPWNGMKTFPLLVLSVFCLLRFLSILGCFRDPILIAFRVPGTKISVFFHACFQVTFLNDFEV